MSERYTRLFSLPENLGLENCPVVISAGALLKDNITGKVLAQLKLRNLSHQAAKAVKVKIHAYDTAKAELNGVDAFSYQDLNVPLDGEFGSQTPILLPDAATRSFTVDILSVVLADGTVYSPAETQASSNEEVLNKVKQLDKGRIALAKKAHWRQLFRLSFIPLLLVVIAFGCHFLSCFSVSKSLLDNIKFIKSHPEFIDSAIKTVTNKSIIPMFIPCMCILASWSSKRFSKAPTVALVTGIVCLAIQFLCAVFFATCVYIKSPLLEERWFFLLLRYIRGSDFFWQCKFLLSGRLNLIKMGLKNVLRDILYFAKNISAVVILYQHVKSVKRGTL